VAALPAVASGDGNAGAEPYLITTATPVAQELQATAAVFAHPVVAAGAQRIAYASVFAEVAVKAIFFQTSAALCAQAVVAFVPRTDAGSHAEAVLTFGVVALKVKATAAVYAYRYVRA